VEDEIIPYLSTILIPKDLYMEEIGSAAVSPYTIKSSIQTPQHEGFYYTPSSAGKFSETSELEQEVLKEHEKIKETIENFKQLTLELTSQSAHSVEDREVIELMESDLINRDESVHSKHSRNSIDKLDSLTQQYSNTDIHNQILRELNKQDQFSPSNFEEEPQPLQLPQKKKPGMLESEGGEEEGKAEEHEVEEEDENMEKEKEAKEENEGEEIDEEEEEEEMTEEERKREEKELAILERTRQQSQKRKDAAANKKRFPRFGLNIAKSKQPNAKEEDEIKFEQELDEPEPFRLQKPPIAPRGRGTKPGFPPSLGRGRGANRIPLSFPLDEEDDLKVSDDDEEEQQLHLEPPIVRESPKFAEVGIVPPPVPKAQNKKIAFFGGKKPGGFFPIESEEKEEGDSEVIMKPPPLFGKNKPKVPQFAFPVESEETDKAHETNEDLIEEKEEIKMEEEFSGPLPPAIKRGGGAKKFGFANLQIATNDEDEEEISNKFHPKFQFPQEEEEEPENETETKNPQLNLEEERNLPKKHLSLYERPYPDLEKERTLPKKHLSLSKILNKPSGLQPIDTDSINDLYTWGGEGGQLIMSQTEAEQLEEEEILELAEHCAAAILRNSTTDQLLFKKQKKKEREKNILNAGPSSYMTRQSVRGLKKIEFTGKSLSLQKESSSSHSSQKQISTGSTDSPHSDGTAMEDGLQGKGSIAQNQHIKNIINANNNNTIIEEPSPLATSKSGSSRHDFNISASLGLYTPKSNLTAEMPLHHPQNAMGNCQNNAMPLDCVSSMEVNYHEIDKVNVSIMEWLLNRQASALDASLSIDEKDEITHQSALSLLMHLVKYSNNALLKQKTLQNLNLLSQWQPLNNQIIANHRTFHPWLLDLLLSCHVQALLSPLNLKGSFLAVLDIGVKLHTTILKYALINDHQAYRKLHLITHWANSRSYSVPTPNNNNLDKKESDSSVEETYLEGANHLVRHLWEKLIQSIDPVARSENPSIQNIIWQSLAYIIYYTQEIIFNSHTRSISEGSIQKTKSQSILKWLHKFLYYTNNLNDSISTKPATAADSQVPSSAG
jgi:hypothetical protein